MSADRVLAIQAALRASDLELLALVPGPNLFYATGAALHASERESLLFIPREGDPFALVPVLEAPSLRPLGIPLYEWRDEEGPEAELARLIARHGLAGRRLGVEAEQMRYRSVARLRALAPSLTLQPADDLLGSLRARKTPGEIAAIRRAIEVTEQGLRRTIEAIAAGQTEREVAAALQINLLRAGADGMAFGPLVVSGPRSAEAHGGAGERALQPGDMIIIDCGATVGHYSGDITRCVAIEPLPDELAAIHDLCRRANRAGREAVRPGASGADVDRAARRVIDGAGYGQYFVHRTGHGLGLEIHEPPYINQNNPEPLAEGNVFTIEPGIYLPGLGGVRVEDNLVVTADGGQSLTTFPRELIRIDA